LDDLGRIGTPLRVSDRAPLPPPLTIRTDRAAQAASHGHSHAHSHGGAPCGHDHSQDHHGHDHGGAHAEPAAAPEPEEDADPEVVKAETDAPQPMGPDYAPELSEADEDAVMALKQAAADAASSGAWPLAIETLTQVLMKAPSPLVYAKRAAGTW